MPRYVEQIVECHNLASERRKAGKPIWDRTIDIGSILSEVSDKYGDEPDNQTLNTTAKRIADLIRAQVPESWLDVSSKDYDRELEEIVEEFDDIGLQDMDDGYTLMEHFNGWLEQFYDWADYKRVWTGGLGSPAPKADEEAEEEEPSRGPGR